MEKSYRDLFDALAARAAEAPELKELIGAVESVDDSDPLRIPALKAMKRNPPPPIALGYTNNDEKLVLYARNTVRKRKAPQPAVCGQVPALAWLFEAQAPFPLDDAALRAQFVELVRRSFGYLETRIANYFELEHDAKLLVTTGEPPTLEIKPQSETVAAPKKAAQSRPPKGA
mgnify:CR=1 FL=1|jgi:hypothetical protein